MQKTNQLIYLLRGEHYLFLKATEDIKSSSIRYSVPLNHADQIPILLKADGNYISYKIIKDTLKQNQIIKFELNPMKKNEEVKIHFEYWVLRFNNIHKNLPSKKTFLDKKNLPDDTKKWLVATKSVQSNNPLIFIMANILKGFSKNMLWYAKKIAFWSAYHRLFVNILKRLMVSNTIINKHILPNKYWWYLEDALSALMFGALCAGRANLILALLRTKGIPARLIIVNPTTKGKNYWLDAQHYIVEFYCPEYGWVRIQPGAMPHFSKHMIPIRIISPEEENIAGGPLSYYGGMAPWFWIDNKDIVVDKPPEKFTRYKIHKSKKVGIPVSRGWIESKLIIPLDILDELTKITSETWVLFTKNFRNHKKENESQYCKAIDYQKQSISHLKKSEFNDYIKTLKKSRETYINIKQE